MKLLIKNGRVVDPAQRIDGAVNLLVGDGKVLALTREEPSADAAVDAAGLVICPGFIDMHAHEDPDPGADAADASAANLACGLRMGVTTALTGKCGDNYVDPADYFARFSRGGLFVNSLMLAGYTYYRQRCSAADRYTAATAAERAVIRRALAEALSIGCCGVSLGLEYTPGADADEIALAAALCGENHKLLAAHIRACADRACAAAEEVMDAGVRAGAAVQLSHIGSMAAYGQMDDLLRLTDAYRADGLDVHCDCYPYDAFSTHIGSAPYDDLDAIRCRYGDIELCEGEYRGRRCTKEIFEAERRDHPGYLTVGHVMREEEICLAFAHPNVAVGSDCLLNGGRGHPRAAGAFPRFLAVTAPASGLSLGEAIRRVTALPASILGLRDKGTLRVGADADLVAFDPARLRDRADFERPTLPPEGIEYVFLGGELAVRRGRIVNGRLGRAIPR